MPEPVDRLFQLSTRGPVVVVLISADQLTALDATDEFGEALLKLVNDRQSKFWVLDFQNVTFMVTPALNTLVNVAKLIRERGGALALTGLNKNIAQVFSLMRLDEVFGIHPDVDAAVNAITPTVR